MSGNILSGITMLGGGVTGYVIPFLIVLTIVVFFHELGHFLVARWCGIKVIVFSIGFGPELVGFNDKHGTRWKISAVPLGGYVKFFGDENAASVPDTAAASAMSASEREVSFQHQSVPARAAVVAAGPIANFILAILIFAGIAMLYGKQTIPAKVDAVLEGSAAASAGFKSGDLVVAIDGTKIDNFSEMQRIVTVSPGKALEFKIERDGAPVTLMATPKLTERTDNLGNTYRVGLLGISANGTQRDAKAPSVGPLTALQMGVGETWFIVHQTMSWIGGFAIGRESADQLGGPGRIAQMAGQVWQGAKHNGGISAGAIALINLSAALSVSIGLLNLFPIPLLDGGHLLFYFIEAIRGRPLSEKAQEVGFRIGLAIVLMLMVFVTYNDILHFARL
jgi:regulator of sigma E protease